MFKKLENACLKILSDNQSDYESSIPFSSDTQNISKSKKTPININEQKEQAENKNTIFNLKEIPQIKGDYSLIKQVVINLISNAIKYSSKTPKPVIEIGANDKETEVVYYVKDNGVGFDMKYVHKLFGVFQRLHSVEEYEGTGVGLAIIQRIINKHNGKVWAESNPGKETVFYFSLPKI